MGSAKNAWEIQDLKTAGEDFYSALTPVTYFGQVTGIFPLTIKGTFDKRHYSRSYVVLIYGMAVFATITGNQLLWTTDITKILSNYTAMQMGLNIMLILETSMMFAILTSIMLNTEKFANVLDTVKHQGTIFRKLGIRLDYAAETKQSYIRLGIFVSIVFALHCYEFFYNSAVLNWHYQFYCLTRTIPAIWKHANAYLFSEIIYLLSERFRSLNENLMKIIEEIKDSRSETMSCGNSITSVKVRSIATLHGILSDAALKINQIFGLNIVVTVVHVLISQTISLYYIIRKTRDSNYEYLEVVSFVIAGIANCMDVVLVVLICSIAENRASLTGKLIHNLKFDEMDTKLHNALHHQKIQFSALGLFPLNPTFIQSIVGTLTTYLIILIQFDVAVPYGTEMSNGTTKSLT